MLDMLKRKLLMALCGTKSVMRKEFIILSGF
jgi:hypothetical protein